MRVHSLMLTARAGFTFPIVEDPDAGRMLCPNTFASTREVDAAHPDVFQCMGPRCMAWVRFEPDLSREGWVPIGACGMLDVVGSACAELVAHAARRADEEAVAVVEMGGEPDGELAGETREEPNFFGGDAQGDADHIARICKMREAEAAAREAFEEGGK